MATVKDLLKTAILTGAVQATRVKANDVVEVSVDGDNYTSGEQTIISPVDGYFSMAVSDTEGSDRKYMGLKVHADGVEQSATVNDSELSYSCHVPVKKGSSVRIRSRGSSKVWWAHFVKVIGGGVNCPTLSAIFEKGGGLCLRLKTASETSVKQAADWLSHLHNAPSSSRLSAHRQPQGFVTTSRPQTAMSLFGLRAPLALLWSSLAVAAAYSSFHRTPPPRGGERRYLVPVARSLTTHFGGAGSSKGRSTSFLLSVASNNHYMEVAA